MTHLQNVTSEDDISRSLKDNALRYMVGPESDMNCFKSLEILKEWTGSAISN